MVVDPMLAQASGYLASALVFAAFYMRTMVPLRWIAIASNVAFLGYGVSLGLWPVAILHALLLPLNTLRLVQIRRMLRAIGAAKCSDVSIDTLARHFMPARYARGAMLFRKGDRGDSAYYVGVGEIEFPEIRARCGAGDLFGEIAMFSPEQARTSSAICATDAELYRIDEHAILTASYQDPALAFALLRLVTRRLLYNFTSLEAELGRLRAAPTAPGAVSSAIPLGR